MKFILFVILLVNTAYVAFAHLGENSSEVQNRYGPPLPAPATPRKPATVAKDYNKNGIRIRVHYLDSRACLIEFFGIAPSDRQELLKTLEDGSSWGGGFPYNLGSSPAVAYRRSDGAMAIASGEHIEVFTKAWKDASDADEENERRNRVKGL